MRPLFLSRILSYSLLTSVVSLTFLLAGSLWVAGAREEVVPLVSLAACLGAYLFAHQVLVIERRAGSLDFMLLVPRPLPWLLLEIWAGAVLAVACGAVVPLMISFQVHVSDVTWVLPRLAILVPLWAAIGVISSLETEDGRSGRWLLARIAVVVGTAQLAGFACQTVPLEDSLFQLATLGVGAPLVAALLAWALGAGPAPALAEGRGGRQQSDSALRPVRGPARLLARIRDVLFRPVSALGRLHPELSFAVRWFHVLFWLGLGAFTRAADVRDTGSPSALLWLAVPAMLRQALLEIQTRDSGLEEELAMTDLRPASRSLARIASTLLLLVLAAAGWMVASSLRGGGFRPLDVAWVLAWLMSFIALAHVTSKRMSGVALPVLLSGIAGILVGAGVREAAGSRATLLEIQFFLLVAGFLALGSRIPSAPPYRSAT